MNERLTKLSTTTSARCEVHNIPPDALIGRAKTLLEEGWRLALCSVSEDPEHLRLTYLFLKPSPDRRTELVLEVPRDRPLVDSLASLSFPASRMEREMHDLFGVIPTAHPLPRRLVRHSHWPAGWYPMRNGAGKRVIEEDGSSGFPFIEVGGRGVYEIPVGPVHAGLIEPGHFRFSAIGEKVLKLKIRLWYLHKGIEKLFEGQDPSSGIRLAERISGDSSVAHALAYTLGVEDALGIVMPDEAQLLRSLLLELERLYNHIADIGAMANDVGFSVANAHAQQIREQLLRINKRVTGHRLLRGALSPSRVVVNSLPSPSEIQDIAGSASELANIILSNSILYARFANTAKLDRRSVVELGCLGYVARASGLACDARIDHPIVALGVDQQLQSEGDVLARFVLRRDEFAISATLCQMLSAQLSQLRSLDITGNVNNDGYSTSVPRSGIGIVEGTRGGIVTRVELAENGILTRVKVVDPSWFNWPALPIAMHDTFLPDFPLVNKSFNLSYAGNDL